jgi:uracil-DNA glycosylase
MTRFGDAALLPTYHPSYLLRNEKKMPEVLEDMEKLRELLR